jgi:hypothetical protein
MIVRNTPITLRGAALNATTRVLVPGDAANITLRLAGDASDFVAQTGHPSEITSGGSATGFVLWSLPAESTDVRTLMAWLVSATNGVICDPILVMIEPIRGTDITVIFPAWNSSGTYGVPRVNDAANMSVRVSYNGTTFTTLSAPITELLYSASGCGFYRVTIPAANTDVDSLCVWPVSATPNTRIDRIDIVTKEVISLPAAGHVWNGARTYGRQTLLVTPTRTDALESKVAFDPEYSYGDPALPKTGTMLDQQNPWSGIMATVRVRKAFRDASGFVTGLTPQLRMFVESTGAEVTPALVMAEVATTGLYFADVITDVPLIGAMDGGAALLDVDDRYDRVLIHPGQDSRAVIEDPTGTFNITFITRTSTGERIPAVRVDLLNASGQVVRLTNTDANGEKVVVLDGGGYTVVPHKPMVNFDSTPITVVENTTIILTGEIVLPNPPVSGVQSLYGTARHGDNSGAEGVRIVAKLVDDNQVVGGAFVTLKDIEAVSNSSGYWNLSVIQGAQYDVFEVWSGKQFFKGRITVTTAATKDLSTYTFA